MKLDCRTLEGNRIRLQPLSMDHHPALCSVGLAPELWEWSVSRLETPEDMRTYIEEALRCLRAGSALPYAITEIASGSVVGSTRFGNIALEHRRVEIGWTWITPAWQRSFVNTEAKYLLLAHAFEVLGCIRVEFKTDSLNRRSRAAILRLGATEEGLLRNHMIAWTGRVRHSVYFSVTDAEWPRVKASLEAALR